MPEKDYDLVVPDEIVKVYPDVGIFVSRAADWAGTLNIETMHGRGAPVSAIWLTWYMSVSYKGDIVACCNDFNHQHVMGNIHDLDDLGEFWFGPQHQDLLRRQKCDDIWQVFSLVKGVRQGSLGTLRESMFKGTKFMRTRLPPMPPNKSRVSMQGPRNIVSTWSCLSS